jgi:phosphoribosylformylglycinamidine synthase
MLSESQERMLMVLKPGREDEARAIFEKWDLDFAVVGQLTDTGRMVIRKNGRQVADLPIDPLAENAPEYDRPWEATPAQPAVAAADVPAEDAAASLLRLLGSPDLCARRWVWEQYDHMVMGDTVQRPGGDAAVVRVHGTTKGLALSVDCTPRYVLADPVQGGRQAVAESWRNLTASGARPLAVTDNMNFGNPEKPRVMGQFVGACQGMAEACAALGYPVVSGNVSLYNETGETAILPTPAIGGLGLIDDLRQMATIALRDAGETLVLLGETRGHLGQSLYLREIAGREEGAPPPVDLAAEKRTGDCVRALIHAGRVSACHDVADGGLLVALAEMALAGEQGAELASPQDVPLHAWLFGEDQGRYLVATAAPEAVLAAARDAGVPAQAIGATGGTALKLADGQAISLQQLREAHEGWLPAYMGAAD